MPIKSDSLPSIETVMSFVVDIAPTVGVVAVVVSLILYLSQKVGARRDIIRFTVEKEAGDSDPNRPPLKQGFFNGVNTFFTDLEASTNNRNKARIRRVRQKLDEKSHIEILKILLAIESSLDEGKTKSNTIVGLMLEERFSTSNRSAWLLIFTIICYSLIVYLELIEINILALLIPLILLSALLLDRFLITLRIRRGWYGRNEYEAREIINYVISHANKDDFNDDAGLKKLMDAPELVKEQTETLEGGVRT